MPLAFGAAPGCLARPLFSFVVLLSGLAAALGAGIEPIPIRPDPVAGRALAADLCALFPNEAVEMTGMIKIRRRGMAETQTPFRFQVIPGEKTWLSAYRTLSVSSNAPFQQLTIVHTPGQSNQYLLITATTRAGGLHYQTNLVANPTNQFADSDFLFGDLGLEFLRWQEQRVLKSEMKMSRSCKVLESKPGPGDHTLGYGRVVAWIDNETGGIIQAEAYDARGKSWKNFELNSFEKVNGRWQLQEMEMRNTQTRSRTRLTFDVKK